MNKNAVQLLVFRVFFGITLLVSLMIAGIILFILFKGIGVINWQFLTDIPRNGMRKGGIFPAIIGTLWLVAGSAIIAFPLGVSAGVFMVEYAQEGYFKKIVRLMTGNLAGIPSIVFGLFGMALFVNGLGLGVSLISGCLTMAILVLPTVIRTTEEAMQTAPKEWYESSYALGATHWKTIKKVVLPAVFPQILTGMMLSVGRIAGETAPVLFTVAAYYLPRLPESINSEAMLLSYHLYVISTSGQDIEKLRPNANGTALVLLALVLLLNLGVAWLKRKK